jgi:hypothetical protein
MVTEDAIGTKPNMERPRRRPTSAMRSPPRNPMALRSLGSEGAPLRLWTSRGSLLQRGKGSCLRDHTEAPLLGTTGGVIVSVASLPRCVMAWASPHPHGSAGVPRECDWSARPLERALFGTGRACSPPIGARSRRSVARAWASTSSRPRRLARSRPLPPLRARIHWGRSVWRPGGLLGGVRRERQTCHRRCRAVSPERPTGQRSSLGS